MTHSSSFPEWQNTINTPSPIFFPSSSPTPKLSSTPSKKPPSPVDWHEELARDESNSAARETARARRNNGLYHHAPFTFDGDLTLPDLDILLEKLQQSTLSTDTMTSSFIGDLDDDNLQVDDLFAVLSLAATTTNGLPVAATAATDDVATTLPNPSSCQDDTMSSSLSPHLQKQMQQESDSQQLRQWLEQLPEFPPESTSSEATTITSTQELKRASLVKFGKQWVTRMKKAASNGISK